MPNPIAATRDYLKNSIAELKKVTWPSRDMTMRYSMLVVTVSVALAAFFAALDFGLSQGVTLGLTQKTQTTAAPVAPPIEVTPTVIETEGENTPITITPGEGGDITLPPIQGN